jgi:hypothetical protein
MSERSRSAATRQAFEICLDRGARGRDWPAWAAVFTDDAVYTEHCLGQFVGRDAIEAWIVGQMEAVACMSFSVEWIIVDGDRLAYWIWNHLPSPTGHDDHEFCFPNLSMMTYAGNEQWSAQEDFYDPAWTSTVIDWFKAGGSPDMAADLALLPLTPSHPVAPVDGANRSVVAAALASLAPPGTRWRYDVIDGPVGVGVFDSPERAYAVLAHVDAEGTTVFSQLITNPTETINPCR